MNCRWCCSTDGECNDPAVLPDVAVLRVHIAEHRVLALARPGRALRPLRPKTARGDQKARNPDTKQHQSSLIECDMLDLPSPLPGLKAGRACASSGPPDCNKQEVRPSPRSPQGPNGPRRQKRACLLRGRRARRARQAVVASAAVLSTVRRVSTASPILASLQSCRGASRLVGSSFGGLRSPVWSDPRYGRYTFPRGQYRTTRPRLPILHPSGVHSRHGADHVVKRSNRSIDLRIRPREYVGLRIRKLEAGDPDHYLVRMPSVAWPRTMPAQPSSDRGANFSTQRRTVS